MNSKSGNSKSYIQVIIIAVDTIEWQPKAARQLNKIADKKKKADIYDAVQVLATWPDCTANIIRLQGRSDYRLRVGNFRVIFEIDQSGNPLIINIMQVEKRNESTY